MNWLFKVSILIVYMRAFPSSSSSSSDVNRIANPNELYWMGNTIYILQTIQFNCFFILNDWYTTYLVKGCWFLQLSYINKSQYLMSLLRKANTRININIRIIMLFLLMFMINVTTTSMSKCTWMCTILPELQNLPAAYNWSIRRILP